MKYVKIPMDQWLYSDEIIIVFLSKCTNHTMYFEERIQMNQ